MMQKVIVMRISNIRYSISTCRDIDHAYEGGGGHPIRSRTGIVSDDRINVNWNFMDTRGILSGIVHSPGDRTVPLRMASENGKDAMRKNTSP